MIRLENINKKFRTSDMETSALNNVNLYVEKGDFISIMGPSGCGKSTLLNVLGMLDAPTSGKYYFLNEDVSDLSETQLSSKRKQHIAFIFQSFNLIDELTVYESVELPLLYQKISPKDRKAKVESVLNKVNISHRKAHLPKQLSGGQQQRVAVARALVTNPDVIFADEPTGNLDSTHGDEVMALLKQLNKEGTTILMVTHSQYHAEYANRIVNLLDGKIISENQIAMVKADA